MAIKGGNPLFIVDYEEKDYGFVGIVELPAQEERMEMEVTRDHPLYDAWARFGWETKTRNTIGAVTDATKRTPEGAAERAKAIFQAYDEGKWNVGRGEGEGTPGGGIVARAVAELLTSNGKPTSAAQVAEHVKSQFATVLDKKAKANAIREAWDVLEVRDDVAPVVKRLREEAAATRLARLAEKASKVGADIAAGLGL